MLSSAEAAPCAILRGVQPTVALLAAMQQAADAAAEALARAPERVHHLHSCRVRRLGCVCAALRGLELQGAAHDALGKRVLKALADFEKKKKKINDKLRNEVKNCKRIKNSEDAAAREAASRAVAAAALEETAAAPTTVFISPAAAVAAAGSQAVGAAQSEGQEEGIQLLMRSDSQAATALAGLSARAWSCTRCGELHAEAHAAREAAVEAAEAMRRNPIVAAF